MEVGIEFVFYLTGMARLLVGMARLLVVFFKRQGRGKQSLVTDRGDPLSTLLWRKP